MLNLLGTVPGRKQANLGEDIIKGSPSIPTSLLHSSRRGRLPAQAVGPAASATSSSVKRGYNSAHPVGPLLSNDSPPLSKGTWLPFLLACFYWLQRLVFPPLLLQAVAPLGKLF